MKKNNDWFEVDSQNGDCNLFCFHHAGSSSHFYNNWNKLLNKNINLIAVQLPGRGTRIHEPLESCINTVSSKIVDSMLGYLDKKFILFGHSIGGMIGMQVTKILSDLNKRLPETLIVSASRPSHIIPRYPKISDLSDSEFIAWLQRFQGTSPELFMPKNLSLLRYYLPILRADMKLSENFTSEKPYTISCNIHAVAGIDDQLVTVDDVYRWKDCTNLDFNIDVLPGNHFYLDSEINAVVNIINSSI